MSTRAPNPDKDMVAQQYCSTLVDHSKLGPLRWVENQRTGIMHACRFDADYSVCGKAVVSLTCTDIINGPVPGHGRSQLICTGCARALYRATL